MPEGFRANLGGIDVAGFPNNNYRLIRFPSLAFDTSEEWDAAISGFVARTPGVRTFQWQAWIDAGAGGSNAQFVAKLIKNAQINPDDTQVTGTGTDVVAGIGVECAQPGVAVVGASVTDLAATGDVYQLFLWTSALDPSVGCTVNGNPAHTWFSGCSH